MTVNSEWYADMLLNFPLPTLDEYGNEETSFQQDGATSHTANISIELLKLAGMTIFLGLSVPPDLTAPDFFFGVI